MTLGDRIATARLKKNMTQKELAKKAGISRVHLACIEIGYRSYNLRVSTLHGLAKALKMKPERLMGK